MFAYLLLRDNVQSGPYSLYELKLAGIRSTDKLWIEGRSSSWQYPDEIEELQAFVHASSTKMNNTDILNTTLQIHHKESPDNKIEFEGNGDIPPYRKQETKIQSIEKKGRESQYEEEVSPESLLIQGQGAEKQENRTDFSQIPKIIKVIIADDHTLFREGVKMALSQKNDVKIVGEAENGMQLLHLLQHNLPDVILLDIQMPVMDGIAALTSIRKRYGDIKVIMLTMYNDRSMVSTLMEAGANGYLTKTADSESIYEAIKTCYSKSYYFNELTNMSMLERIRSIKKIPEKTEAPKIESVSQEIVKIPDLQKRTSRRKSRKRKKYLFIAACSILLITSGIMAGISILKHSNSNPIEVILTQSDKPAEKVSPPINIPQAASPQSQQNDSSKKMNFGADSSLGEKTSERQTNADSSLQKKVNQMLNVADSAVQIKTSQTQNSIKGFSGKREQDKKQGQMNTAIVPVVARIDSNNNLVNPDSAKSHSAKVNAKKALARKNISHLVTAFVNNYHKDINGGLSNIEFIIYNQTVYKIDQVTIELKYVLPDFTLYKTEILSSKSIVPLSSRILKAPESSKGVKIEFRILSIKSKELEL